MSKSKKQGRDVVLKFNDHKRKRVDELEADVDALFQLPLAEFTGARNALAAQLKKSGRGDEAVRVKALAKPSVSAWAVNQLYWNRREAFDQLLALGERFHKAQSSRGGGKIADMRTALEGRREALTQLSDLATSLLRDAGHNPAPDTIHRITTTLEGISAYAQRSDGRHPQRPGRLTNDVDPPGFESLAGFSSGAGMAQLLAQSARVMPSQKSSAASKALGKAAGADVRQAEAIRKAKIANAKASLQDAKRSLTEARAKAHSREAAQKKADAEAKKTEKQTREAEEDLRKAKAASEAAARHARSVKVELEEAASAVEDAELTFEEAAKELESLLRESPGS